jgi:cytochrome c-type biogenesis protein
MTIETSVVVSALAGLASFLSPCILPILPAFISYLSGTTICEIQNSSPTTTTNINEIKSENRKSRNVGGGYQEQEQQRQKMQPPQLIIQKSTRLNIFLNTVYFVLGFSLVFAVLGVILNSFLVTLGIGFQHSLTSIGGTVIVAFGVYLILSTKLRMLNFEKRMTRIPKFKTSYITSFVFGAAFAGCWTPCRSNIGQYIYPSSYLSWHGIQFVAGLLSWLGGTLPHYWSFLFKIYWSN